MRIEINPEEPSETESESENELEQEFEFGKRKRKYTAMLKLIRYLRQGL